MIFCSVGARAFVPRVTADRLKVFARRLKQMSALDKKIKHFVIMRFFSFDDPKYPHDIYDTDFLANQLVLAKNNALSSLDNQTNKNFDIVFILNVKFFDNPKYEFILTELQNGTALPVKFIKNAEQPRLVKEAMADYDFVIQSRMDLDDFVYKDAVAETHAKADECVDLLSYGYCKGYIYTYGELYPQYNTWEELGHQSILQSLILKSSFARNLPFMGAYGHNHGRVKTVIQEFLEKNGIAFAERMFQQNISDRAYIYFRHENSHWQLTQRGTSQIKIPDHPPITNITKEQLAAEFGFHYELKSIK